MGRGLELPERLYEDETHIRSVKAGFIEWATSLSVTGYVVWAVLAVYIYGVTYVLFHSTKWGDRGSWVVTTSHSACWRVDHDGIMLTHFKADQRQDRCIGYFRALSKYFEEKRGYHNQRIMSVKIEFLKMNW